MSTSICYLIPLHLDQVAAALEELDLDKVEKWTFQCYARYKLRAYWIVRCYLLSVSTQKKEKICRHLAVNHHPIPLFL